MQDFFQAVIRPFPYPHPQRRRKDIRQAPRENLPIGRLRFHTETRKPLLTGHAKGRLKVYPFRLPRPSCYKSCSLHPGKGNLNAREHGVSKNDASLTPIIQNSVRFRKYTVNKLLGKCIKPFHQENIVLLLTGTVNGLLTRIHLNFNWLTNFLTIPRPLINIMILSYVKKEKQ